ncbi:ABC transporter ATP-binding protein [Stetteria hydrogenophila]
MKPVEVEGLHYSYNGRPVLRGVSLEAREDEFLVILGPNGAGKSTLLKCIAGLLQCRGVRIYGRPVEAYSRGELAGILAYVPQRVEPTPLTVFDTVLLGRRPYMGLRPSLRDLEAARRAIEALGISHLALRPTSTLSGGELQKVALARALAQEPRILLLDEPTNNLDIKSQLEVMRIARGFADSGGVVVAVMHDVNLALRFGDRFIFMKNGRIAANARRGEVKPEIFEEVYGVKAELVEVNGAPIILPLPDPAVQAPLPRRGSPR